MIGTTGVERALNRFRVAVVILHIVGENHKLRDVGKALEPGVLEPLVDAIALSQDAFTVIRLLHFNKDQRHAVDQQGDVWPKFFIAILAGQFGDNMEAVVVEVFEVDQLGVRAVA